MGFKLQMRINELCAIKAAKGKDVEMKIGNSQLNITNKPTIGLQSKHKNCKGR